MLQGFVLHCEMAWHFCDGPVTRQFSCVVWVFLPVLLEA